MLLWIALYVTKITLTKRFIILPLESEKIHSHTCRIANTLSACISHEPYLRGSKSE